MLCGGREPENVNLCKFVAATEPYGLSLRGIEKETVRGHPSSERINRPAYLGEGSFRIPQVSVSISLDVISK